MGTLLSQLGYAACTGWAELLSDKCPTNSYCILISLFSGFCQHRQFLLSEFLTSDNYFHLTIAHT